MSFEVTPSALAEYRRFLKTSLSPDLAPLADFFANPRRLALLDRLLGTHCPASPRRVLNVGCGAFATEYFLPLLANSEFVSFDYTPGFAPLYDALRSSGKLPHTTFFVASATDAKFAAESFDLILMHDLFYEPALNAPDLLLRYRGYLKPGGLLFFDAMDQRAGRLWKILGKDVGHRRYDLQSLRAQLLDAYWIVDSAPCLGVKGRLDALFRRALWHGLGVANNVAFLIRRR